MMGFTVQAGMLNVNYQINVGEHFLLDVIQEMKGAEMRQHLEQRVIHLVSVLEKCVKTIGESIEVSEEIIRNEVHLRYDAGGVVIAPPTMANNSF